MPRARPRPAVPRPSPCRSASTSRRRPRSVPPRGRRAPATARQDRATRSRARGSRPRACRARHRLRWQSPKPPARLVRSVSRGRYSRTEEVRARRRPRAAPLGLPPSPGGRPFQQAAPWPGRDSRVHAARGVLRLPALPRGHAPGRRVCRPPWPRVPRQAPRQAAAAARARRRVGSGPGPRSATRP